MFKKLKWLLFVAFQAKRVIKNDIFIKFY